MLIKECDDWEEKDEDMPRIILDDKPLPSKKNQRHKYLEKKVVDNMKTLDKLCKKDLNTYKAKSSLI